MRTLLLIGFTFFSAALCVPPPQPTSPPLPVESPYHVKKVLLLGEKECTWGPRYWCESLRSAAGCHATKHCIQTVWMHSKLPPDHSSVCDICLKMVKEARDQLLSNETQEEIKEVFEGSCKLLPIKIIADDCCKLADDFIVELVDTLASEMNPQIVCSVAGLCNNERVHELLEAQESQQVLVSAIKPKNNRCEGCHKVLDLIENKFNRATRDQVLQNFLQVCGHMGSFSDACSNVIITYFNEIYKHLEENLNANEFCLMSGECSAMFHTHTNVEITPLSNVGFIPVGQDDLPCDLCKQLVKHLQDILIANTTEDEFHKVLTGICKQTKSFKDECLNLVNQYYPLIYNFLVNELNGSVVCSMVNICPGPGLIEFDDNVPIIPLLPSEAIKNPLLTAQPIVPIGRVPVNKAESSVQILPNSEISQLPIERLVPQTLTIIGNTELCVFCEYFLNFVQKAITDPATEEKIKHIVDEACDRMPSTLNETCRNFVDTYGPAFIAIFAQDIDPSIICPKLSLCPSLDLYKIHDVEVFMNKNKGAKPNCPLCILAMSSLEEMIKNKRTQENIRNSLSKLCSHLSKNLALECNDFVATYTDEIIEACLAELNPQEICVYLNLCEDKIKPPSIFAPKSEVISHIETNEISDYTENGKVITKGYSNSNLCVLCEFVFSEIKNELKDNATEDEIKKVVHNVCLHMPKSISKECDDFTKKYEDIIIQLLIQSIDPSTACTKLDFCTQYQNVYEEANDLMHVETMHTTENVNSPQCYLCKLVMVEIEKILQGDITEDKIKNAIRDVCTYLPKSKSKECSNFINKYGDEIIDFLKLAVQPAEICSLMFLCKSEYNMLTLEVRKCSVCEVVVDVMEKILENPNVDHALEHVLEKTCRALPVKHQNTCRNIVDIYGEEIFKMLETSQPSSVCTEIGLCGSKLLHHDILVGADKCTRGPGYWCINKENAAKCGATEHCQKHEWNKKSTP